MATARSGQRARALGQGVRVSLASKRNYGPSGLPSDAQRLSGIEEVAFRNAIKRSRGFGICANLSQPALGEALLLGWSYR